ncbi:MAG: xanthine dehydrogenase family protein [Deltaproteobacteria bacterium]|nr:xanthine dehydrogenase family protein [Deltaproteobacteria bacterium]
MVQSVGTNAPRLDCHDKLTGRTKYLDDLDIPHCWFGGVVYSSIPYGRIIKINFDPSFDWGSVVTCTFKDIPGKNNTVFLTQDQPILAEEYVKHVGEAIVLVAAPTKEILSQARSHIHIEYAASVPVLTIEQAKDKATLISGKDNILAQYCINKGDLDVGFKEAAVVIEGEYQTGFHEHAYIETQAMAAVPRTDGGLTVMGSLQCPYYVLKTLVSVLNCGADRVNVRQLPMGGSFGGKEDYPSLLGSYVALLAKKSGRPVKLIYSREDDIIMSTKRHPSIVKHKTGVKKDGTLTAMEINVEFNGGAYATMSPVVLSRGVIHAAGPYRCDHVRSTAVCYATHNVPCGAFRGFGVPQTIFAIEAHMDKIAEALGINPLKLRAKNCLKLGDTTQTKQLLRESVGAAQCLDTVAKGCSFEKKWQAYRRQNQAARGKKNIQKGIGLALYMHGGAFTGSGESVMKTEAGLMLQKDGVVRVLTGCTEMGQGAHTVLPQIVADTLGIPLKCVYCEVPDTDLVPDSGPTVASRTTMIVGWLLTQCAASFKERLFEFIARTYRVEKTALKLVRASFVSGSKRITDFKTAANDYLSKVGELKVIERYKLPPYIQWDPATHIGDAYPAYSWAADVAEVSVDMDTFEVTVDKMTIAVELGRAINPVLVKGQMEGGTLQALGWALMEDMQIINGHPQNKNLQTYIIPTARDIPDWRVHIIEEPFSYGPMGAKGIGELPLDGGAPAIVNAIYNATGLRITEIPVTPEKLLRQCAKL